MKDNAKQAVDGAALSSDMELKFPTVSFSLYQPIGLSEAHSHTDLPVLVQLLSWAALPKRRSGALCTSWARCFVEAARAASSRPRVLGQQQLRRRRWAAGCRRDHGSTLVP